MGHFPARYVPQAVDSVAKFAAFEGRLDLTRVHPSTTTDATFVVPALYDTVQINLFSTAPGGVSYAVGETVCIGELYGYYSTAASPTPLTNPVRFTLQRLGSWRENFAPGGLIGLYIKGPAGQSTTNTSSLTVPTLHGLASQKYADVSVAVPGNVPNSSTVKITSYAGVYEVVSIDDPALGLMTVRKIYDGDLVAGDTVSSGAYVSAGVLLGVTPNVSGAQFFAGNLLTQVLRVTAGGSANTPAIAVGWGANADSGDGLVPFGQFVDGDTSGGGTMAGATTAVVDRYKFHYMQASTGGQENYRRAVPAGMPLMARVHTRSTATVYDIAVCVRGFFSEA